MSVPKSEQKDLHLITMNTPNGKKVQIALEELKEAYGTDFSWELVDIKTNRQKEDWFLKLNPNGRIPVLVDNKVEHPHLSTLAGDKDGPFPVFESAAILLYLAKKVDKDNKFGYSDALERSECLQWMFFTHGGIGPMQGQSNHFGRYAPEQIPYAKKRYHDETLRLYGVLEIQLSGKYHGTKKDYLAGPDKGQYSWADISTYPWVAAYSFAGVEESEMNELPNVKAWIARIAARPAVKLATGDKYALPQ